MSTASVSVTTIEAVWRAESARIVAGVARLVGDVGLAEELAGDALVAALEQWPREMPSNPGAWLMTAARRRAIDRIRRDQNLARKVVELGHELGHELETPYAEVDARVDGDVTDDVLRLVFTACHPVLPTEGRVALTLKVVGGLTTPEIARAFLVPEATMAQRIVRAKRRLTGVPFEVPQGPELAGRLESVLEVVYLVFNEGYSATAGSDWTRPALCGEALRLGRLLTELMPGEAEVHGLQALMELQASRLAARVGADGEPVRLNDQDRSRWDRGHIARGLDALGRAEGAAGPYVLQAAIAACHATAASPEDTDWARIAELYASLAARTGSAVVELNRAVALAMAFGPERGLALVDELTEELRDYHLLPSVRGDLLERLGREAEARAEFERAAALTRNERERDLLLQRARQ